MLKNNRHTNYHLQNAYNKYDSQNFKFEVLELVESEDLLLPREQYYIELYQVCDKTKGYNLIIDATRNVPSGEIRKKISETLKGKCVNKNHIMCGKNHPMYGRKHSLETRKKISEALKGKYTGKNNPMYGKYGALNPCSKKVICLETGVIYDSIREAGKLTGICCESITKCCKGKLKTTGKYHWQYYKK